VKPAVFPVPVWADANTSLPSKMGGIAFFCIGEGVEYPFLLMAFNKASDKPNELNDINSVYEVNTIYMEYFFIWREDRANFFDVSVIAPLNPLMGKNGFEGSSIFPKPFCTEILIVRAGCAINNRMVTDFFMPVLQLDLLAITVIFLH
jgi:hypothetical protein